MFKQFRDTNYYINEQGEVINKKTNRKVKGNKDKNGYIRFRVCQGQRKSYSISIHRAVLETFNPIENMETLEVNHKDENKTNNCLSNLEWVTHFTNMQRIKENGHSYKMSNKGSKNGNSKLSEEQVLEIREKYKTGNFSQRELSKIFNISQSVVQCILSNKNWKFL